MKLNDPNIQRKIFEEISKQKNKGDDEIPPSDENFIDSICVVINFDDLKFFSPHKHLKK